MQTSNFWTVVVGVLVFAASQYVLKLIVEPVVAFRRILSNISSTLLFHHERIVSAQTDPQVADELRRLAADLRAGVREVPVYLFLTALQIFDLPDRSKVFAASKELNDLSHSMSPQGEETMSEQDRIFENAKGMRLIGELLEIETAY